MISKIDTLKSKLPSDIDAVLIVGGINRRYFTGLRSSAGTVVITKEKSYLIADFRYIELAKKTARDVEVILQDKLSEQLKEIFAKHNVKTVGVETSYMTMKEYLGFKSMLPEQEIVMDSRVDKVIWELRKYKTKDEFEIMQTAQKLADKTFSHILNFIKEGRTEIEIALEVDRYSRLNGSEAPSFSTIAVGGVKSSLPHGVPGDYALQKGDFFTLDFGVTIDGYVSDMTRTVAIGECSDEKRRVYETVLKAQQASFDAIKLGGKCSDVDKAARDLIYSAGYEGCFGHGLGHGLGMQVHEDPRFSAVSQDIVEPGIVMSVEPGIYLEGKFGCRIEDVVYVTETGFINLTGSKKELIIL